MYRAKPITQRDNSSLQYSNCRMASISTGLDFHTLGKKTSTGGKMRTYTTDQSGGTDSGDAREAWTKGYSETLVSRDGKTWADALVDLRAGHLINLDVWHETCKGPCLSGSGRYGHNMAVAPEKSGTRWLVSDPWCKPGSWQWWPESLLRAGAEEWGRRLRTQTGARRTFVNDNRWIEALQSAARQHMTEFFPGREQPLGEGNDEDPDDTGGPGVIMYTRTRAQSGGGGGGGDDMRFVNVGGTDAQSGMLINVGASTKWEYLDGSPGGDIPGEGPQVWIGKADSQTGKHIIRIDIGAPYSDKQPRPTHVLLTSTNQPYTAPMPEPPLPPSGDCNDEVAAAVTARDTEWEQWALDGAPSKKVQRVARGPYAPGGTPDDPDPSSHAHG
jgi:hypothetical protein